jgi:hypothetical protein
MKFVYWLLQQIGCKLRRRQQSKAQTPAASAVPEGWTAYQWEVFNACKPVINLFQDDEDTEVEKGAYLSTMSDTTATPPTAAEFDAAYKAAQPAAVKELMAMPNTNNIAKVALARELATQGYVIDGAIMVWGWDPFYVTTQRIALGYTWVPSYLQPPVQVAPGLTFTGEPAYDPAVMPIGAIPVTLDMAALLAIFTPTEGTAAAGQHAEQQKAASTPTPAATEEAK